MMIDDPSDDREEDAAKELLLADLSHLQESFWKNEETGEKRVTFFITLVTAVITALVAISGEKGVTDNLLKELLLYFAFSSLFLVGLVTLFRLIKRNEVTDGYKKDMRNIRERFRDYYDDRGVLFRYRPFASPDEKKSSELRKFGGLAYTVAAINSLLVAAATAIALYSNSITPFLNTGTTIVIAFVAGFLIQIAYIRKREEQSKRDFSKPPFTHAGGVVVRYEEGKEPLFLIVSTSKAKIPPQWVLPKGHINTKTNESMERTAVREVWEEAGVVTSVRGPLGVSRFRMREEDVVTKYFLLEYIDEKESPEKREKQWCPYKEGSRRLTFPDARKLLRKADYIVSRHSRLSNLDI
ncbi:NUDIX domain-containing protein [Syntrophus gentianae]|uniref:NUDIX domain-containing protein n=1 Tax=Syntrophus gentianae TaxID=43775 RepID=A0A1H7UAR4_9BACT|nr:NUDIX domain-containing protein [Syntrophus gentianae]SEL93889.1 NUDIX domain-containing protein [Syntrophus gentianae]